MGSYERKFNPYNTLKMAQDNQLSQDFAQFMKQKRMALGLNRADLAERIYGDRERRSYIWEIENGKRDITVLTMGLILDTLGAWVQFTE